MTAQAVWVQEAQLPPVPASAGSARVIVKRHLTRHDLHYLVDDICLVVSELVTNAVVHARTPIRVRLEELLFCVKLTVFDESVDRPVLRLTHRGTDDTESGRGLWIVDACSADWGTDLVGDAGKCTWAVFGVRPRSTWVDGADQARL